MLEQITWHRYRVHTEIWVRKRLDPLHNSNSYWLVWSCSEITCVEILLFWNMEHAEIWLRFTDDVWRTMENAFEAVEGSSSEASRKDGRKHCFEKEMLEAKKIQLIPQKRQDWPPRLQDSWYEGISISHCASWGKMKRGFDKDKVNTIGRKSSLLKLSRLQILMVPCEFVPVCFS